MPTLPIAGTSETNAIEEMKEPTLLDLMTELQNMSTNNIVFFSSVNEQLKKILSEQAEFREKLNGLTIAQGSLEEDHQKTKSRVEILTTVVSNLSDQVNSLKQARIEKNLVISGLPAQLVPEQQHVLKIADILGTSIREGDVEVRQVPTKKGAITKVVFSSKDVRDKFLQARRGRSVYTDEIGLGLARHQLFFQEDLTPFNQVLMYQARKLKQFGFSAVVNDGRVKVKHMRDKKKYIIKCLSQIEHLMKQYGEQEEGPE
jgi:hypothetical protein